MSLVPVVASAVACVVFSAAYYIAWRGRAAALGAPWARRARQPRWQLPVELGRALVVALVVAQLVALAGVTDAGRGVVLAIALWAAFPLVLLIGSVTQEKTPLTLAAIHAGDWLAKLVIIAVVTSLWR